MRRIIVVAAGRHQLNSLRSDHTGFLNGMDAMLLAATQSTYVVTQSGIGLGSAIAVVCSWQRNMSILMAIIAGLLSWLYVIYFALTRRPDEVKR
jgi:hypothetical protein